MGKSVSEHADYLLELISKFHKFIDSQVTRMPAPLASKMTLGQMRVIHYLIENGPTTMRTLANHGQVVMSTMTDMANRMVRLGVIKRRKDPADRRLVLLEVTPRGRKEFVSKAQHFREHVTNVLRPLDEKDREKLFKAIQTIEAILTKQKS